MCKYHALIFFLVCTLSQDCRVKFPFIFVIAVIVAAFVAFLVVFDVAADVVAVDEQHWARTDLTTNGANPTLGCYFRHTHTNPT